MMVFGWFRRHWAQREQQAETIDPIVVGDVWKFIPVEDDPWANDNFSVRIMDVKSGWVRYSMGSVFCDCRKREPEFRQLYRRDVCAG